MFRRRAAGQRSAVSGAPDRVSTSTLSEQETLQNASSSTLSEKVERVWLGSIGPRARGSFRPVLNIEALPQNREIPRLKHQIKDPLSRRRSPDAHQPSQVDGAVVVADKAHLAFVRPKETNIPAARRQNDSLRQSFHQSGSCVQLLLSPAVVPSRSAIMSLIIPFLQMPVMPASFFGHYHVYTYYHMFGRSGNRCVWREFMTTLFAAQKVDAWK